MIPRFAIRHPVAVGMIFAGAMLLGLLALRGLPVDLLPDLQAPRIAVLVRSGDRPPEEVEDRYARVLEAVLSTISHVTSVRTLSSTGRVLAIVECDWQADMDRVLLDVQSQVGALAADRDVDSLVVRRFDPSARPIMELALEPRPGAAADLDALRRLAGDRIARALERVPGVAMVQVAGGRTKEARVAFEPERLRALGLSADDLLARIQSANAEASGGTVEDRGRVHVIEGLGRLRSLDDLARLPVPIGARPGEAPHPVPLTEIAAVSWQDAPVRGLVTVNGVEGISLSVFKEAGENTVAVSAAVRKALPGLVDAGAGVDVAVVSDQSTFIRAAMREVELAAILGGVLSVLVLFAFLRSGRAVALIALAIPVSIVITFALMSAAGLSLNVMTLGGLALGTGIVIDNAIVVLEAVFRRLEEGQEPHDAAEAGTVEVGSAITASTLTHCVVFLPVAFLHGIASQLFRDLAFTVVVSLACSLAVAMLLIPAAAARLFPRGASLARGARRLADPYERILRHALRRPGLVVTVAAASIGLAVALAPHVGVDFLPSSESGEVAARLVLPEGTRATVTAEAARRLESAVREAYPSGVTVARAQVGEAVQDDVVLTEEVAAENRGELRLVLADGVPAQGVREALARAAAQVEGLSLRLEGSDAVLGRLLESGPPVRVEVRGQDLPQLERATASVAEALSALHGLADVHSSFEDRRAEVRVTVDRPVAAGLGLTPDAIARQLRQRLGAESATRFRIGGEDRDVVLRGPQPGLSELGDAEVQSPSSGPVRLQDVARVEVVSSPTRIERSLGTRVGAVTAQVGPSSSLGAAAQEVERALRGVALPDGVRAEIAGAETTRRASYRELSAAVLLAIALVTMVMASLFESLVHPFTILFTLPTAGVGVVAGLLVAGLPASVPAFLGVVMLAGIAVNNGILLVDVARRQRAAGLTAEEAVLRAGRLRLRPILMTSIATVLGMLPMAFGGQGSDLRAPLAVAVIGGLVTSTLLTLVLVPVVFCALDRLRAPRGADGATAPT